MYEQEVGITTRHLIVLCVFCSLRKTTAILAFKSVLPECLWNTGAAGYPFALAHPACECWRNGAAGQSIWLSQWGWTGHGGIVLQTFPFFFLPCFSSSAAHWATLRWLSQLSGMAWGAVKADFFSFFPPVFAENCWISELDGMGGEGHTAPQGVTELSTVLLLFRQVVFMSQNKVHLDLFSFWQNVI